MSNPTISLGNFQAKALEAERVRGTLRLDNGALTVKGTTFLGKAALWIKDRVFPDSSRAQNMKVLNALQDTLNAHYKTGEPSAGKRISIMAKPSGAEKSRDLPTDVLRIMNIFEKNEKASVPVKDQAADHFARVMDGGGRRQNYILAQAGSSPEALEGREEDLRGKYADFVSLISRNPHIADGVVPSARDGGAGVDVASADSIHRNDGLFTDAFLDGCLIATLRNEAAASDGGGDTMAYLHAGRAAPLGTEDMDWLARQYDSLMHDSAQRA